MVWLLWIFVVGGGLLMGGASALSLVNRGFDLVVAANALLYLGTAAYGAPRLLRLVSNTVRKEAR
jgi:hypothetical protein